MKGNMEITNGEIWIAREPLSKILQKEWPVKTAFQLAKLSREIHTGFILIETMRNDLIKKYGKLNEETKRVEIAQNSENWPMFVNDWTELLGQVTKIDLEAKIRIPDGTIVCIEPAVLIALDKFIEVKA
jgi:hypothetical protein